MTRAVTADEIRRYWDERAAAAAGAPQATTDDVWLRRMEVAKLSTELAALRLVDGALVADIGCGDGRTVIDLARDHPSLRFLGIDYSSAMIDVARDLLQDAGIDNRVRFVQGDATALADMGADFDVAMTDRVLINLPSWDEQRLALREIAEHVRPGGAYLAIENFLDGHDAMNALRREQGLAAIPIRWHNRYLEEDAFLAVVRGLFDTVDVDDFTSTYYLVTRVAYSAVCAREGVEPDYAHPLHEIASTLPATGRYSPIRFIRMRKAGS